MIWAEPYTLVEFVSYLRAIKSHRPMVDAASPIVPHTCTGRFIASYAAASTELASNPTPDSSMAFRYLKPEGSPGYSIVHHYLSNWLDAYNFAKRNTLKLSPIELESLASELRVRDYFSPRFTR